MPHKMELPQNLLQNSKNNYSEKQLEYWKNMNNLETCVKLQLSNSNQKVGQNQVNELNCHKQLNFTHQNLN